MICCDNKNKYFHYDFEQLQMFWCGILIKMSSKLPLSKKFALYKALVYVIREAYKRKLQGLQWQNF